MAAEIILYRVISNNLESNHVSRILFLQPSINSGGGMPMGYGGYSSQPMDHQGGYGGPAYGAMGMMGAGSFSGGMPMG